MLKYSITVIATLCCTIILMAQSVSWTEIKTAQQSPPDIQPKAYNVVAVDFDALKAQLSLAPTLNGTSIKNSNFTFSIPSPDGSMWTFNIAETPIMAPGLQVQYPNIRTFTGQGTGNYAHATARFDYTLKGFHAQILIAGKTYYIDPYSSEHHDLYIVYTREAFYANNTKRMDNCEPLSVGIVSEPNHNNQIELKQGGPASITGEPLPLALATNGTNLRTYRLALACTGEYADFHGGTVPLVMSAMTTSMNRVNGVFVRDMSLQMIMVDNNDELIHLDGGSDPYSNGNGSAMLGQNQTTCNSIIGTSNYDIGHVFSTGGGGVAYLQSVCGSSKAGGVTGQASPIGDPFDIDYVAHEMGHQWGGNHSQNNSCNRSSGAAYEPGSASTIMGYAGICSPNIQSNSDDHFNNHSYNEMYNFSVVGSGNSCAVTTSSGNTPPTISVQSGGFFIPIETPFELTATADDADDDALTFCWEQHDLGPSTASGDDDLTNPSGNAPIFRSWSPTTDGTRVFPRLFDVINGSSVIGELLPTYSRDLTFRCTVRDNAAAGGGVTDAEVAFEATESAGPFVVSAPNTNVSWIGNSTQIVLWDVANTDAAPVNCSEVDIYLSLDGGWTYPHLLANNVPNNGSASVVIPNATSTMARIKVKGADNIFFDISNQNFSVQPGVIFDLDVAISGIDEPAGDICGDEINPQITLNNLGTNTLTSVDIIYDLAGGGNGTVNWTGSLITGSSTTVSLPTLSVSGGAQTYDVELVNPNGGTDENSTNNTASQNFNVMELSGEPLPIGNDFEGTFPGTGWAIGNPDDEITWIQDDVVNDVDCNGSSTASINFYSYNSSGETDDIVSPMIDLQGATAPEVTFDYAYARYSATYFDRMQVQVISNCDANWTTVWDKANLTLATAGSQTSSYSPECGDWASEAIDLSAYAGSVIQVRFRGLTGYGNILYLDNISVFDNTIVDCNGVIDGSAYLDDCEICVGGNTGLEACIQDCNGVFGGTASLDECGVCDSNPANDNQTCLDCNGVVNGPAYLDACGVCDDNPSNDNDTCLDCAGIPNGSSYTDACGVCDDNPSNDNDTCLDCAGVPNGPSYTDACGVCDDNPSNDNDTCLDCAGVPNGAAYTDACGVCDDNPSNDNDTCLDCAGIPNGSSYTDACGVCDDNPSNDNDTCLDCAGIPNGPSYTDACGVCDDNPANDNDTCLDCAGVPNGAAYTDACGVCDDNPSNDNDTCLDCAGVPNGDAIPGTDCVIDSEPGIWNADCLCEVIIPCDVAFLGFEVLTDPCEDDQPELDLTLDIFNPNSETEITITLDYDFNFDYDDEILTFDIPEEGGIVIIPVTLVAYGMSLEIIADLGEGPFSCTNNLNPSDELAIPNCEEDCLGVPGGSAYMDECGVCDTNPDNDNETCLDCAGIPNGSAFIDDCETCVGGSTGIDACIIGCMSPTACNYNPEATIDNGECIEPVENCYACNETNDGLILIDDDEDGICNADETSLNGTFADDYPNCASRDVEIWVYQEGTSNLISTISTTLIDGSFSASLGLSPDHYDIYIKIDGYLSKGYMNFEVAETESDIILEGLVLGDINDDDGINITDVSVLNAAFNSLLGDENFNADADLDCSGGVNIIDVSILNQGFNQVGDHAAIN